MLRGASYASGDVRFLRKVLHHGAGAVGTRCVLYPMSVRSNIIVTVLNEHIFDFSFSPPVVVHQKLQISRISAFGGFGQDAAIGIPCGTITSIHNTRRRKMIKIKIIDFDFHASATPHYTH